MGKSWCHRCDYCQPCPQGISISTVIITKSIIKRMPFTVAMNSLEKAMEKAKQCTECEECIQKCPYNLEIPTLLKENISFWKDYKNRFTSNNKRSKL